MSYLSVEALGKVAGWPARNRAWSCSKTSGAVWFDHKTIRLLADQSADRLLQLDGHGSANLLTDREQKVLLGILAGLSNKKIGENLGLSEGSVKASVQQLFFRTGVRTRSQFVRTALEGSLATAKTLTRRPRNATTRVAS